MVINLHVQQLWWLYLLMLISIDALTIWVLRKETLGIDAEAVVGSLSVLSMLLTLAFMSYVSTDVLKIKVIMGN